MSSVKGEILLSFIIPVYNVELYLQECIESILTNIADECEVILVNDGSTDSSGLICDRYAANSLVTVIHKENGGLSSARNAGLLAAKGQYVTFVDSDDKIYPNSIGNILNWIKNEYADICFLCAEKHYPDGTKKDLGEGIVRRKIKSQNRDAVYKHLATRSKYPGSAWAKLFRRDFLICNDLYFPHDRRYSEDLGFIRDCILHACDFDAIEVPYYQYRQKRKGSITNTVTTKSFYDLVRFIGESANKLTIRKKANNSYSNLVMGFVAYEYCVLMYLYNLIPEESKRNAFECLEQYVWVMNYAQNKKSKIIRLCIKIMGIKVTTKLLKIYR